MPGETRLQSKPYGFIPFLEVRPQDRAPALAHHDGLKSGTYSGTLVLKLFVEQPLHIGSGGYIPKNGDLVRAFCRRDGQPVIPGSSVKGAVRSIAEAVSHSCAAMVGRQAADRRLQELVPAGTAQGCTADSACMICRMFGFVNGSGAYRGKVHFGEFCPSKPLSLADEKFPALQAPFKNYPDKKVSFGNERLYYCQFYKQVSCGGPDACPTCSKNENWHVWRGKLGPDAQLPPGRFRGRKVYRLGKKTVEGDRLQETASSGSVFSGEISFQALTAGELSLLVFALGLDGSFRLRLGYGKPAYYGVVRSELQDVLWPARPYIKVADRPDRAAVLALAEQYGAEDLEVRENRNKLVSILGTFTGPVWGSGNPY